MIYVFADLGRIVTSNVSSASMTFIERRPAAGGARAPEGGRGEAAGRGTGAQNRLGRDRRRGGTGAEGFDVSPDGEEIWAANAQDGTISVIEWSRARRSPTRCRRTSTGANRLKFTPDGKRVLGVVARAADLAMFDVATRKELTRMPIGRGAAGLEVQPTAPVPSSRARRTTTWR